MIHYNSLKMKNIIDQIPKEARAVAGMLEYSGFEAYFVGGCVRDLLLKKEPKDWDITTNATPEEIIKIFPKTFYENKYGTVGVVNEETTNPSLKVIEVTPYRIEGDYKDNRHPDTILFSKNIEDDLSRRDFTINALALNLKGHIIDNYKGQSHISSGELCSVGNANERFQEDALRILRAVRLSTELGFMINKDTEKAIIENNHLLKSISRERVRDEFVKIVSCENPYTGLSLLRSLNLMSYIVPELEETYDIGQNKAHRFDVWTHLLKSLQHAADKRWPLSIRLAALFHDIGKPRSRRFSKEKNEWTFYGHDVISAKMTERILNELRFQKALIQEVVTLVRWHMFFSDTEQITLSAVRRIIANVGTDHIWDLMNLRICDRVGTGRPKENPYRLRKYKSMIEEVLHDPITVSMLKINGKGIIDATKSKPGPKIGFILHALLEEVLNDPKKNTIEYLTERSKTLYDLPDEELLKIGIKAKETKDKEEEKQLEEIRKKHWVS